PIWRALRGGEWDVLDIHEEPAALATAEVLVLAWLAGVRPAVALYSAQNIAKRYPPPFRWFERVALRRAAAVHTCNDEVGPILRAKGFRGRVENLGLGVDVAHFAPEAVRDAGGVAAGAPAERSTPNPAPESVRETVAAGAFQVGYVGRLEARKGIFVLLDAVAGLSDVEVTFVGAGRDADRLAGEVAGRRLGGRATVDGFVAFDDLPGCYRRFDVVVVPSLDRPNWIEQFGRVVVEAMATGVPVVASDSGSLPEVVADAGLVVPQGDAGALAAALERLRDDAALRVDLAVRGRRRAEHFSWSSIAARQADLYRAISWQSDRVVGSEGEGADEDVPHGDAPTS
ncbi:MAG: glycosyltransferase, partial [Actinobacteria bacterium]|nr:glycosyltransferase [Actinomycetota bacterium]